MPCTKCKDGKYKWGKTGECKYDTKEACEKANPKKYNKMQPTPLGKKSYEEYEKELKEYNLSATYRVELGIADDVEKLTQQAKDLIPDLDRDVDAIKVSEKNIAQAEKQIGKRESVVEKADKKERELARAFESAKDNLATAERELKETKGTLENNKKDVAFLNKRLEKTKGKASKLRTNLEKKLNTLEKAAKDLGVKIPTGEASKVLKKLISLL
jgi:chromosome segregation ATPase